MLIGRSIYLSSVPASALPADAAAAAIDAMVHFIKITLRLVLAVGLVVAIGAFLAGSSAAAVRTRSGEAGSGLDPELRRAPGSVHRPGRHVEYAHRKGLRIGSVALFALIFVFWGQPTAPVVIVLVVLLLVVLGLIELIGLPAKQPQTADQT